MSEFDPGRNANNNNKTKQHQTTTKENKIKEETHDGRREQTKQ